MGLSIHYMGILAAVFIGIIVLNTGCLNSDLPDNFRSDARYELDISANIPLQNATFLVPLPVKNDTPMVGTVRLNQSYVMKDNCNVDIIRAPQDIPGDIGIPRPHNNTWYLKISTKDNTTDRVFNGYHLIVEDLIVLDKPGFLINTYTPHINESVFLPKHNFHPTTPVKETIQTSTINVFNKSLTGYRIPVFINVSSTPNVSVRIRSEIHGANTWFDVDSIGNYYSDSFIYTHSGDFHGWQNAEGTIIGANGVYPNMSDPVWQKALNKTNTLK